MSFTTDITDQDLENLASDASQHGDTRMARIAKAARHGNPVALNRCRQFLLHARVADTNGVYLAEFFERLLHGRREPTSLEAAIKLAGLLAGGKAERLALTECACLWWRTMGPGSTTPEKHQ